MPLKTLIDGRQVPADSEEWRAECEAREILSWPLPKRREFVNGHIDPQTKRQTFCVRVARGDAAADKLITDLKKLYDHYKNAQQ